MRYLPHYGSEWEVMVTFIGKDCKKYASYNSYIDEEVAKSVYTALINLKEIFDEHGLSE